MEQKRIDRITNVVEQRQRGLMVVFEDIHDPHNAAAILRTCDALGIQKVSFVFDKEKRFNPKRIGKASSSSANKWLDFMIFDSTYQCINTLVQDDYTIIATAFTDNAESLTTATFPEKNIAILVGNEHAGLSQEAIKLSDRVIQIPMAGFVQSLNVSVAAAIMLWEITRQRKNSAKHWNLTAKQRKVLLADFLKRANT